MTQPAQSGIEYGAVPLTWQETGQQQRKSRDCNTVSSSRWAFQLKRRPVPRFGGFLHCLKPAKPSCCRYARFSAAPLPPPPRVLASAKSFWCAVCTPSARRFATCSFSATKQRFMYCSAAFSTRLNDPSEPLNRLLRCQRPVFSFGGQVEQR